jgi:RNA polymerase sigma factor (sigma-70 family)
MATGQLRRVLQTLRTATLPPEGADLTDGQLLQSYVRSREEAAFAALVRRHGPMVWGVCRRLLRHHEDAEDAFQATFLVLVRKAAAVISVANWLYGVAHQTALKARATAAKRRGREKQVTAMPEPAAQQHEPWDDLRPLLDQELSRLPDKYREVIVLCDLEGKTRKEAARQLDLLEGTVASRLARGRDLLGKRLARYGPAVSGGVLAAVLSQQASAAVPLSVVSATIKAASLFAAGPAAAPGVLSPRAVTLAEGVLKTMLPAKLKIATAVLVALAVLGVGASALTRPAPADQPSDQPVKAKKEPAGQPGRAKNEGEREALEAIADWPQWRGPNRDGVVHGVTAPAKWPKTLTEEWQVEVGKGVASPVVVGGNVYVFTRQEDNHEVVWCLDLRSGKQIWRSKPYPAPYKPGGGEDSATADQRPRSTPAVAGGRVYTLGMSGVLSCLDARTGGLLWRKEFKALSYGGTSPLVADGLCIVHVGDEKTGGLTAFDAASGEVKWCYAEGSRPSSASPILVTLAGERQVVTFTGWGLLGVSAATGKKLWALNTFSPHGSLILTPVRYKDLLIAAGNNEPPCAIRLEKGDKGITAKEVWKAKGLSLHMSTPVLAGDLLFGMSTRNGGCFFCLDANSGKTLWESDGRQGGHASILNAGSVVLFLTSAGRLIVVKPSATAYEPIAEYRVSDRCTDAHPVFLGDRILIKDHTTLRSFRIEQDGGKD